MSSIQASSAPFALVVDDDGLIRMDAVDILEQAGFHALEASTGDHALELLHTHHADVTLLFTDVVASGLTQPGPGDLPDGARFIAKPFSARIVHRHLQEVIPDDQKPQQLRK
jgi:DNA-binding NarL/FixJ family response regulator